MTQQFHTWASFPKQGLARFLKRQMYRVVYHIPNNDARVSHRSCDQQRRQVDMDHLGRPPCKVQFTHDRISPIRSWKMACFGQSWEEVEGKETELDLTMKNAVLSSLEISPKTHTCVLGGVSIWLPAIEKEMTVRYCCLEKQQKKGIVTNQLRQEIIISYPLLPPTPAK